MHPLVTTRDDGRDSSGRSEDGIRRSTLYALFIKPDDRIPDCFRVREQHSTWYMVSD